MLRKLSKIAVTGKTPNTGLYVPKRFVEAKTKLQSNDVDHFGAKMVQQEMKDRTSLQFTLPEAPGFLDKALKILKQNSINMTWIQSEPPKFTENKRREVDYYIDIEGELSNPKVQKALSELRLIVNKIVEVDTAEVPWFPKVIDDLDLIGKRVCGEADDTLRALEANHARFRDPDYKRRRNDIAHQALDYKISEGIIPTIFYNKDEIATWNYCYLKLKKMLMTNACEEANQTISDMEKQVEGYGETTIPQLQAINDFLDKKTGWQMKPVGGLLMQREFLNALAFKVFHSTQYVRYRGTPEFSAEPDIIHELVGHAPMLAHKDLADFCQQIGIASLGASEIELKRLAALYWFTIEFGMCLDRHGHRKAYGAGILSSLGELEYCQTDKPTFKSLDPYKIAQDHLYYPTNEMQPIYFVAESFEKAKNQISLYCNNIQRPFNASYNAQNHKIEIDRKIRTYSENITGNPLQ